MNEKPMQSKRKTLIVIWVKNYEIWFRLLKIRHLINWKKLNAERLFSSEFVTLVNQAKINSKKMHCMCKNARVKCKCQRALRNKKQKCQIPCIPELCRMASSLQVLPFCRNRRSWVRGQQWRWQQKSFGWKNKRG